MHRTHALAAVPVALLLLATAGCGGSGTITKQEEDLMRRPVGSAPMPPEAAAAMQRANQEAAARARQRQ